MLRKLKVKIILAAMGVVVVMLAVIFGLVYHFTKADLENSSYAMLQSVARDAADPGKMPEVGMQIQLPYFVVHIDNSGHAIAAGYSRYDITDERFLVELVQLVLEQGGAEGVIDKYQLMYTVQSGTRQQTLVFLDISSFNETLNSLVKTCLIIAAICIVIMLAVSLWFASWAVRPVATAWKQQKQFISDASHELKTPLSVILSNAELLQNEQSEENVKRQCAENIDTMSRQMRHLVEGMLELSRVDNGQIRRNFEKIDFSELIYNAALPFEPIMYEAGLRLCSSIQPDVVLKGSVYHLRQLVEILLDNAVKYSASGIVGLQLTKQGKTCTMTVSNPGEPIPKEELERIFERFYRVDKARTGSGSFGLGLSIAKSIVLDHKGKIWAISNSTGNCFCVQLTCDE